MDSAWKAKENLALSLAIQEKFEECEPIFWETGNMNFAYYPISVSHVLTFRLS